MGDLRHPKTIWHPKEGFKTVTTEEQLQECGEKGWLSSNIPFPKTVYKWDKTLKEFATEKEVDEFMKSIRHKTVNSDRELQILLKKGWSEKPPVKPEVKDDDLVLVED